MTQTEVDGAESSTPESDGPPVVPFYTMYLDQTAHLDWDWVRTFDQNYWFYSNGHGIQAILDAAIRLAENQPTRSYSICEMGFLRRYLEVNPSATATIKALGDRFQIMSGGVVSPDCLVSSSEGFIRNYLVGQAWLKQALNIAPKPYCWIFDDFGQGSELPVLLNALGFTSVVFGRIPGTDYTLKKKTLKDGLVKNGYDFHWHASNKSISIIAHYIGDLYNAAQSMEADPDKALLAFINIYAGRDRDSPESLPSKYTAAKTKFMYMPVADDFLMPVKNLVKDISDWNKGTGSKGAHGSNVRMQLGTFDTYMKQLLETLQSTGQSLQSRQYNGTPYWTGYYASRPELKRLHFETTRALIAAEVFGLLTQPNNTAVKHMLPIDFWKRVDQAWTDFVPSTHHDFITGTAPDGVYANEQLPILRGTTAAACFLRDIALNALAGMVSKTQDPTIKIMVANSLGFQRGGVAAIEGIAVPSIESIQFSDSTTTATQLSSDGGLLVHIDKAPSLGYIVGTGSASEISVQGAAISFNSTSNVWTISNEHLIAEIKASDNWSLSSLIDKASTKNILGKGPANEIVFYDESESGCIYQFQNETPQENWTPFSGSEVRVIGSGPGLGAWATEEGPLRVKLRTEVIVELLPREKEKVRFVREYELHIGEPFLRMTTTGAAPTQTSVMTRFPLANSVDSISHGTGYHWTDVQPLDGYWNNPVFRPTHDFVMPYHKSGSSSSFLGAVYHEAMPAWAIDHEGSLIGCLLRNVLGNDRHGAVGSDPARHTNRYAIRVPTGLGEPSTGKVLREAQGFHTPLSAVRLPDGGPQHANQKFDGMLNDEGGSLAWISDDSTAIITAAKPGTYNPTRLILRLYQPKNQAVSVKVHLASTPTAATSVTAVETTLSNANDISVDRSAKTISLSMKSPIATVSVHTL